MPKKERKPILPAIELPKGGGAINNIGEKFSVNTVTGTGAASIPIALTAGRGGFQPELNLTYDSGSGNSPFGLGWSLSIPSISRKTSKGIPIYDDLTESDVFTISGAEDLVPFLNKDNNWERVVNTEHPEYDRYAYRPRLESGFAKIEKWINKSDPSDVHWQTISPNNVTSIYGRSQASRIVNPSVEREIFQWKLEEVRDNLGNIIRYEYLRENSDNINPGLPSENLRLQNEKSFTQLYLKKILYCNQEPHIANNWHFQIIFDYGEHDPDSPSPSDYLNDLNKWRARKDPFSTYRSGFEIRTYRLCERILLFHQFEELNQGTPTLVRSTNLLYNESPVVSTLIKTWQAGYIKQGDQYRKKETPPVEFNYSASEVGQDIQSVSRSSLEHLPTGLGTDYQFIDLEGEGIAGILAEKDGGWFYKRNEGNGKFSHAILIKERPSLVGQNRPQIVDLDGDGNKELVIINKQIKGFYDYKHDNWENFTPFENMPSINPEDPNLKLLDLNGDGYADILITEDQVLKWFPSNAKKGYKVAKSVPKHLNEIDGPALVFDDETQSIYLADMSGDGLTDIVRVRNKEICYWPNMGYARFGAKITMASPPHFDAPDHFNQRNIRLADIDGTGTADILYFNKDGARFWINQSGNSWSESNFLHQFPGVDHVVNVQVTDLLGNGTPCLVWSSSLPLESGNQMRFIDLMQSADLKPAGKPYLLKEINNNLGKINRFSYTPSTKFYLEDKAANKPWITRLHFPVYVVSGIETIDEISGSRLTSSYKYHHGYFDPIEREFRGFGMVEQLDSESFEEFKASRPNEEQQQHFIHPILTKTWFHTGAYVRQKNISAYYRDQEYFKETDIEDNPPARVNYLLNDGDVELLNGVDFDSTREAHRAMRGQTLRQEIYSLDGSDKSLLPYSVTETNFTIRQLQPGNGQRHGVFLMVPKENIAFNYERDCCDPRVSHSLTLQTDEYGASLQTAEVVYPRRSNGMEFPDEQVQLNIVLSESSWLHVDNQPEFYAIGIETESKSFEVTGIEVENTYFDFNELTEKINQASTIPFHGNPDLATKQKRLLTWERNYFWNGDQSSRLNHGQVTWPILAHNEEEAVFTPELLSQIRADELTDDQIAQKGGYILKDGYWWNPGDITHYRYHDVDDPSDERDRSNPFLFPIEAENPLEEDPTKRARLFYDQYYLVPTSADDAEGYTENAVVDYRTLAYQQVTDINENTLEAITDELGMVIATTGYGTEERPDGTVFMNGDLPLNLYQPVNDEGATILSIIEQPHTFLQGASSFFYYDLHAWIDRKEPLQFIAVVRETHARTDENTDDTEVQLSLGYSDGFGREIQQKVKVESGISYLIDNEGRLLTDPESGIPLKDKTDNRWLSSGRTVLNNKQKPIKQYEPFYINTHKYLKEEDATKIGLTPLFHYDPLMRLIQIDSSDGFISKIEFTAWETKTYDFNDTIESSPYYIAVDYGDVPATPKEKEALAKAVAHANTPSEVFLDTLGRPFKMIETDGDGEQYITQTKFNITGQPLTQSDPRQFDLNQTPERLNAPIHNVRYIYDMQGETLRRESVDAGVIDSFNNVLGDPVHSWTARGYKTFTEYDVMDRPIKVWLEGNQLPAPVLVEKMVFAPAGTPASKNQRGQLMETYHQSGKNKIKRIGFKGEVLESSKQFISLFDPDQFGALREEVGGLKDWNILNDAQLEVQSFITSSEINALGRVINQITPDQSIHRPRFNHSGQLLGVDVQIKGVGDFIPFVKEIGYTEKGLRSFIKYGNDVKTTYFYHQKNHRLIRLKTTRGVPAELLQDIEYNYDPVGNITFIEDKAQQTIFFDGQIVNAQNDYTYDAFYQLKQASGREHIGQTGIKPVLDQVDTGKVLPHKGDGQAMRNYIRLFDYDKAGNLLSSTHVHGLNPNSAPAYIRNFSYHPGNNRLERSGVGQEINWQNYTYDAAGNMEQIATADQLNWNFGNQLSSLARGTLNAYYEYDRSGDRSRKIVKKGNLLQVRYYLDGTELYREYKNEEVELERETLHIMEEVQRIALVDTQTVKNGEPIDLEDRSPLHRYQLSNHLGSCSIELDHNARLVTYEEYYPYGSTSYQAVDKDREAPRKRYRYSGMERDLESGLNYHNARYYIPWLCRWLKPDPAGTIDGLNVYRYVRGNPIRLIDLNGKDPEPPVTHSSAGSYQKHFNKTMAEMIVASGNQKLIDRLLVQKKDGSFKLNTRYRGGFNAGHTKSGDRTSSRQELAIEMARTNQPDGSMERRNRGMRKSAVEVDIGRGIKIPIERFTARELELDGTLKRGVSDKTPGTGWTRSELDQQKRAMLNNKPAPPTKAAERWRGRKPATTPKPVPKPAPVKKKATPKKSPVPIRRQTLVPSHQPKISPRMRRVGKGGAAVVGDLAVFGMNAALAYWVRREIDKLKKKHGKNVPPGAYMVFEVVWKETIQRGELGRHKGGHRVYFVGAGTDPEKIIQRDINQPKVTVGPPDGWFLKRRYVVDR